MDTISLKELKIDKKERVKLEPNLGLSEDVREEIAKELATILASTYHLMIKTQCYHWNVRGVHFKPIHELTEAQYTEIFGMIDVIAERIRGLGFLTPAGLEEFQNQSIIEPANSKLHDLEMIADLVKSHEAVIWKTRNVINMASDNNDESTADMLIANLRFHEKTAWMLRSYLEH